MCVACVYICVSAYETAAARVPARMCHSDTAGPELPRSNCARANQAPGWQELKRRVQHSRHPGMLAVNAGNAGEAISVGGGPWGGGQPASGGSRGTPNGPMAQWGRHTTRGAALPPKGSRAPRRCACTMICEFVPLGRGRVQFATCPKAFFIMNDLKHFDPAIFRHIISTRFTRFGGPIRRQPRESVFIL